MVDVPVRAHELDGLADLVEHLLRQAAGDDAFGAAEIGDPRRQLDLFGFDAGLLGDDPGLEGRLVLPQMIDGFLARRRAMDMGQDRDVRFVRVAAFRPDFQLAVAHLRHRVEIRTEAGDGQVDAEPRGILGRCQAAGRDEDWRVWGLHGTRLHGHVVQWGAEVAGLGQVGIGSEPG